MAFDFSRKQGYLQELLKKAKVSKQTKKVTGFGRSPISASQSDRNRGIPSSAKLIAVEKELLTGKKLNVILYDEQSKTVFLCDNREGAVAKIYENIHFWTKTSSSEISISFIPKPVEGKNEQNEKPNVIKKTEENALTTSSGEEKKSESKTLESNGPVTEENKGSPAKETTTSFGGTTEKEADNYDYWINQTYACIEKEEMDEAANYLDHAMKFTDGDKKRIKETDDLLSLITGEYKDDATLRSGKKESDKKNANSNVGDDTSSEALSAVDKKDLEPEDKQELEFNEVIPNDVKIKENRNIYTTNVFDTILASGSELEISNEQLKELQNRVKQIMRKLINYSSDEFRQYEKGKHVVNISAGKRKQMNVKRIRTNGNANELRLYYCHVDQLEKPRHGMNANDLVFLGISGKKYHLNKKYIAFANKLVGFFEKKEDIEYTMIELDDLYDPSEIIRQNVPSEKRPGDIVSYEILSREQEEILLDNLMINPPAVVYGAAGTGKTLLSEEAYKWIGTEKPDSKILYLTFETKLKEHVLHNLERRRVKEPNCQYFDELVFDMLPELGSDKYKSGDYFVKEWGTSEKARAIFNQKHVRLSSINEDEEVALSIAYIFYRTHSSGLKYNSFDDPKRADEYFRNEAWVMENPRRKESIFAICQAYDKHLQSNGFITDNMAALMIEKKRPAIYDTVIVDEVQDLTTAQIRATVSLLKKGSASYLSFGDDNQTVNPTLMRMTEAETIVRSMLKTTKREVRPLRESYRSTPELIEYVNYLNHIRRGTIGTDIKENEGDQKSVYKPSKDNSTTKPSYIMKQSVIDSIFLDTSTLAMNNVMIITPNEKTKRKLLDGYKGLEDTDAEYVQTVMQAKGREWETVILYNFMTENEDVWSKFAEIFADDDEPKLHSTIHRMYFNRFYVGLTRAKKKIIICEDPKLDGSVKNLFLPSHIKYKEKTISLSEIREKDSLKAFFTNDFTHEVWCQKAKESFENHEYEEAYDDITRAIRSLKFDPKSRGKAYYEKQYSDLKEQYEVYRDFTNCLSITPEMRIRFASYFFRNNDEEFILRLYKNMKDVKMERLYKMDCSKEYSEYLSLMSTLWGKSNDWSEEERTFYQSKAIEAYKPLIKEKLKEI